MDGNVELLRLRFETMSYNDLRKAAKENNVKASGKKNEIIANLVKKFVEDGTEPAINETEKEASLESVYEDAQMEVENESPGTSPEDDMDAKSDATYVVDRQKSAERDFPETASKDVSEIPQKSPQPRSKSVSSIPRSPSRSPGRFKEYFAQRHAKLQNRSEDIGANIARHHKRHKSLTNGIPSRILELAKPKKANFEEPKDPSSMDFRFGDVAVEDLATVQVPFEESETLGTPPRQKSARISDLRMSAKQMSRNRVVSASGNALLTPRLVAMEKSKTLTPTHGRRSNSVGRISYKPNLKPYTYVDTTKMTDKEFEEYKNQRTVKETRP
ncbi:hypothetical protein FO519_005231 [Halicephalobus sp. NKZ332]|nr:hypothetical protein FO519_005231 [Halicephalobus sp. NKZ332]